VADMLGQSHLSSFEQEESLVLVDLYDQEIGCASKAQAHREALLHRAFSIFVYQDDRILLQRRAYEKYHSGGLIANTCCSHPRKGETLEQAVHRRLAEEMNFDCPLREVFSFVYFHQFEKDLFEYEYDHVFLGEYRGDFQINGDEVEEAWWEDCRFLEQDLLCNPAKYSVWFLTAAPRVLALLHGQ